MLGHDIRPTIPIFVSFCGSKKAGKRARPEKEGEIVEGV